jgi:hypothetical protein
MKRPSPVLATLSALCLLLAAAPPASARVDVEAETHFRCYIVSEQTPQPAQTVTLSDQFLSNVTLSVDEPLQFCAPTSKNGAEIEEPEEHLTMYAAPAPLTPHPTVWTQDQFGPRTLEVVSAQYLLVPTQKQVGGLEFPERLNHYWCYEANVAVVRANRETGIRHNGLTRAARGALQPGRALALSPPPARIPLSGQWRDGSRSGRPASSRYLISSSTPKHGRL